LEGIGAISEATERLQLGTGVTCPIMRIHPAIIAQAAATAALMMPGRFFLGLGTGENLNEHILGQHWPPIDVRRQMLKEAVQILPLLWRGGNHSYWYQKTDVTTCYQASIGEFSFDGWRIRFSYWNPICR
jgi:coenzyme F420-dependent glucose-6-phosphate dehydrogenase